MNPAIVIYKGENGGKFTPGKRYKAYFLEYWEGKRDSLHVCGDDGRVTDFNTFEDFEVISDEDNLLNNYEATVKCITHKCEDLTFGKQYKAIGRDKDGMFLVMDNSYCCYFYPPDFFEIISDEHGILNKRSVYYSFHGAGDEIKKY